MYEPTFDDVLLEFKESILPDYIASIADFAATPEQAVEMGQQLLKILADELAAVDWQDQMEWVRQERDWSRGIDPFTRPKLPPQLE